MIGNWFEDQYQRVEGVCPRQTGKRVLGEDDGRTFSRKNQPTQLEKKRADYFEQEHTRGRRFLREQQQVLEQFRKMEEQENKGNDWEGGAEDNRGKCEPPLEDMEEVPLVDLNGYPENLWSEKLRRGRGEAVTPVRDPRRPFDKITSNDFYI